MAYTTSVRGTPLYYAFPPRTAPSAFQYTFHLLRCLPPRDMSSASRPVFHAASHHGPTSRLPFHSISWLLRLPPPSHNILQCLAWSNRHPLGIHCTAMSSAILLHIPATLLAFWPYCCIFQLHHCTSCCSTLLTCHIMLRDVAWCSVMSYPRPATTPDPPSHAPSALPPVRPSMLHLLLSRT